MLGYGTPLICSPVRREILREVSSERDRQDRKLWIPEDCPGVLDNRCVAGLARVLSVFSIDEGPSFYYRTQALDVVYSHGYRLRVSPREECSDRIHVIRDDSRGHPDVDYTKGWQLLFPAVAAPGGKGSAR